MMSDYSLRCIECGREHPAEEILYSCPECDNLLEVRLPLAELDSDRLRRSFDGRPLNVWRYRELLPVDSGSRLITMFEGGTPLHRCHRLEELLGLESLYIKFDGMNPTGSFKDRGMTVGVTKAVELGVGTVACASTGNTSASLAAYAALAGLRCVVMIPSGRIALGKLSQAMMHGAKVFAIKGNFDDSLDLAMRASAELQLYILNSVNPFRLEGQKTAAFEICDQLGAPPDLLVIPVGNGGNSAAYWKGFTEFSQLGIVDELPRLLGVQAEGASPIAKAFERGEERIEPVTDPETVATAIRIGNPANWKKTIRAIRCSGGSTIAVTDDEILEAQKMIARKEGLFVEPAAAASIAGLSRLLREGGTDPEQTIVCVATGHGLKDPDNAIRNCDQPIEIYPRLEALRAALGR